jgi:tripartite ATP-independent transporter DctM subunit
MSAALMTMIVLTAKREGLPIGKALPRAELGRVLKRAILPLTLPVVLLAGILSGVFTPTEAAAAASFYALLLAGLVYRSLGGRVLFGVFAESMRQSAVIMILIAGAFIVNYAVTTEGIAALLAAWIKAQQFTPLQFMLMINLVFLVLGCLLDTGVLLLVILPLLIPTVKLLGIDLVYFGVVSIVNFMIGLITPPYGLLLFVLASLTGIPLRDIMKETWKFVIPLVVVLMLLVLFPSLVMWLPAVAGYGK